MSEREDTDIVSITVPAERLSALMSPQPEARWSHRAALIAIAILSVLLLVSEFALRPHFSSADAWSHQIESLTEKQGNVTALAASAAGASTAISLLPGDVGTPVADKLADLSANLLIVLAAVFLEKYLLTVLSFVSFGVLIPVACGLGIVTNVFWLTGGEASRWRPRAKALAVRLAAFAVAVVLIVPASVWLSDMIEDTYDEAKGSTIAATTQRIDEGAEGVRENAEGSSTSEDGNALDHIGNALDSIGNAISSGLSMLTQGARDALASLQTALQDAMEAFAVMVVTSVLVPLLVMLFFFWLVRLVTGIDLGQYRPPLPSVTGHTPGNAVKAVSAAAKDTAGKK